MRLQDYILINRQFLRDIEKFRIGGNTALFRQYLPLILGKRLTVVRGFRSGTHLLKRNLADTHPRVERDGETIQVTDFERNGAGKSGIDESRSRVHDNPEASEAAPALHARNEVIGKRNFLLGNAEDKLARLYDETLAIGDGDRPHDPRKRIRIHGVEDGESVVLVELEDISQAEIHRGCMNVRKELGLIGLDLHPALRNGLLDITVGEDHRVVAYHTGALGIMEYVRNANGNMWTRYSILVVCRTSQ